MRFPLVHLLAVAFVALLFAAPVVAQEGMPSMPDMPAMPEAPKEMKPNNSMYGPAVPDTSRGPGFNFAIETGESSRQKLSTSVELVLFITLLTLAPAIVLSMTSFTRIIIVLSFMKRAMSIQEMPPSTVVTGLALFLSLFIMKPVYTAVYDDALSPYLEEQISVDEAGERASRIMSEFMLGQTRDTDLELMYRVAEKEPPESVDDIPFHLIVPAFVLSEIKTAFQMGFVLFLPFLVIDLVIASVLISMGMFTLPPIVISTPFKVLLFILVDGWNLVIQSAIQSYQL